MRAIDVCYGWVPYYQYIAYSSCAPTVLSPEMGYTTIAVDAFGFHQSYLLVAQHWWKRTQLSYKDPRFPTIFAYSSCASYSQLHSLVSVETNGLTSSEAKFTEKALEEIKSSLRASEADKRRMMDRIVKLEDELRVLRVTNGLESNENKISNGNVEDADAERMRLRKELADMRKAKQNAEDHSLKLERLVTQLRSKFNGLQLTNGPESLPSDPEHDTNVRARRTSVNSANNSTVVFGPVTDL
ncbi:hypothetical protein SFRURICE_013480 [Spodoptera frugiperda]|nr:hypothetical protein SFRURICE_013480 [Spodoptera frugiperda]